MIIKVAKSGFKWAQLNSLGHDKIFDAIKHAFEGVGSDGWVTRIKIKIRKYTRNPSKTLLPLYSLGSRNLSGRKVSNLKQITPRLEITKVVFFQRAFKINYFLQFLNPAGWKLCVNLFESPSQLSSQTDVCPIPHHLQWELNTLQESPSLQQVFLIYPPPI